MPTLALYLEFEDENDFEWVRSRAIGVLEDLVEEQNEEGRLDGRVEVNGWDVLDEEES